MNALVPAHNGTLGAGTPWRASVLEVLEPAARLADAIARTEVVPATLRGRPDAVLAALLVAHERGLPLMFGLSELHVIDGKVGASALLMRAQVMSAGHIIEPRVSRDERVELYGRRSDSGVEFTSIWTPDRVRRAGLAARANHQRYPAQMLMARATGELCRLIFPDIIGGLLVDDELDDEPGTPAALGGGPREPDPATRRRRAPAARPAPPAAASAPRAARAVTLLPGEEPDTTPAAPPGEPPPAALITQAQQRKLNASLRDLGIDSRDRAARLAYCSKVVDRTLASSSELTMLEASSIIEQLVADLAARNDPENAAAAPNPTAAVPPAAGEATAAAPDQAVADFDAEYGAGATSWSPDPQSTAVERARELETQERLERLDADTNPDQGQLA
jgi:hypothetical protein